MTTSQLFIAYLSAAILFLILDAVWLTMMNQPLYRAHLADVLHDGFRLMPAILFYLVYIAGIVYFAIYEGWTKQSLSAAALNGAILGFVCYATYDLTNQATLRTWSTIVTVADLAWGTFVTACAATGSLWIIMRFAR
ncbi:MAG: DUF2177 family protein [Beijerinckiaceae bacterium]